jgi:hypothetical protein
VNTSTGKVYAVVSTEYRLVRHEEAIREVEEAIAGMPDLGGFETSTGFYNDGGRMSRVYRFPALSVAIQPGDFVDPTLLLINSYDLSWPLEVSLEAHRLLCGNGLTVGVDLLHMKRRHSRGLELPLIKEEVCSALERFEAQVKEWREWADRPLSRKAYSRVVDKMEFGERGRGEIKAKMDEEAGGRYEMGFPVVSVWGFFNALTWFIAHKAVSVNHRRDMEKRLGKAMGHLRSS